MKKSIEAIVGLAATLGGVLCLAGILLQNGDYIFGGFLAVFLSVVAGAIVTEAFGESP